MLTNMCNLTSADVQDNLAVCDPLQTLLLEPSNLHMLLNMLPATRVFS
jgi:hypothetical protein